MPPNKRTSGPYRVVVVPSAWQTAYEVEGIRFVFEAKKSAEFWAKQMNKAYRVGLLGRAMRVLGRIRRRSVEAKKGRKRG